MATCAKSGCERTAEYDSPEDLWRLHWVEWWVDGLHPRTLSERAELEADLLERLEEHDEPAQS